MESGRGRYFTCQQGFKRQLSEWVETNFSPAMSWWKRPGLPNLGVTPSPFVIAVFGFTLNVSDYNARFPTIAYKGLDQAELKPDP